MTEEISPDEFQSVKDLIDGKIFVFETENSYNNLIMQRHTLSITCKTGKIIGEYKTEDFGTGGMHNPPFVENETWELFPLAKSKNEIKFENIGQEYRKEIFLDVVKLELNYNSWDF